MQKMESLKVNGDRAFDREHTSSH